MVADRVDARNGICITSLIAEDGIRPVATEPDRGSDPGRTAVSR